MITSAAAVLPLDHAPPQIAEARDPPPMGRGQHHSTRAACQNLPHTYPRIPRPVVRQGNASNATPNSQFQVNASQVQKPLSLVSVSFPSWASHPLIDNVLERKRETKHLCTVPSSSRRRDVGAQLSPLSRTSLIPTDLKTVGYEVVV